MHTLNFVTNSGHRTSAMAEVDLEVVDSAAGDLVVVDSVAEDLAGDLVVVDSVAEDLVEDLVEDLEVDLVLVLKHDDIFSVVVVVNTIDDVNIIYKVLHSM